MAVSDTTRIELPLGKRLRYGAEACVFFLFIGFFRLLGLNAASALGGFIGRNIFRHVGTMNRARENLREAFPEKTESEIETIVIAMCDNLGRTVAEYANLDKLRLEGSDPRLELEGAEHAKAAIARGKGVIFFSGHFANWETMPFVAEQSGFPGGEVYRPLNNPFVNRWIVAQRTRNGPKLQIEKGARGTRQIFTTLRRGDCVFLLADQKTNEGLPIPFFGRDAMTTPAPAMFALKLGAALLPASNERIGGARLKATIHPPIDFTPTGDSERDVYLLTRAITEALEKIIRERPSQWLWLHRRWPTKREQDNVLGKRALQTLEAVGVRVDREGSSLT
ncbi:MAG TPA: lysophospholipid acyltransferase family protein [Rhizomicrobium sp.]|jgi:KDO2-lipid IV(A) lauroyltransferase